MHVPATLRFDALPTIQALLTPGESIATVMEWTIRTYDQNLNKRGLFIVTSQSFWILGHRWHRNGRHDRTLVVDSTQTIPLSAIASIADTTTRSMLRGRERRIDITFTQGGSLTLVAPDDADSSTFVTQLRNTHATVLRGGSSGAGSLVELAALREQGLLSDDEWDHAKSLFLGKPVDAQQESIVLLRQLYELTRSGVLSQGEFNIKKWEILSRTRCGSHAIRQSRTTGPLIYGLGRGSVMDGEGYHRLRYDMEDHCSSHSSADSDVLCWARHS